ncbi:clathrin light chain [Dipodascopsis uninucleata]
MSHFPSLEEFDQGQTETRDLQDDGVDFGVPETEEDFIAREKAILGDTGIDILEENNGLSNGHGEYQSNDSMEGGKLESNNNGDYGNGSGPTESNTLPSFHTEPEESEAVAEWRERQALAIQRRDEQSEARKQETQSAAKQAIDDFYENYNDKKDKSIAQTRAEEKEFIESQESTVAGGTAWERIAKLVDLSEKSARTASVDKSRFRELLLSLKSDPDAPGASGY